MYVETTINSYNFFTLISNQVNGSITLNFKYINPRGSDDLGEGDGVARDVFTSLFIRQDWDSLLIGERESECLLFATTILKKNGTRSVRLLYMVSIKSICF